MEILILVCVCIPREHAGMHSSFGFEVHVDCPFPDDIIRVSFSDDFHMSSLGWDNLWRYTELVSRFKISHFDLRLHIVGLTILHLNARWVGRSGLDNSTLAHQFPHFGSGHSPFEWQEGRQSVFGFSRNILIFLHIWNVFQVFKKKSKKKRPEGWKRVGKKEKEKMLHYSYPFCAKIKIQCVGLVSSTFPSNYEAIFHLITLDLHWIQDAVTWLSFDFIGWSAWLLSCAICSEVFSFQLKLTKKCLLICSESDLKSNMGLIIMLCIVLLQLFTRQESTWRTVLLLLMLAFSWAVWFRTTRYNY